MPSTYTTNIGIEKIGTGEQTGTWGDTTNINFDIIDEAINGLVAVTLPATGSSGTPNDVAITDGASSDGRNGFIELVDGGDLGATAFVRITPNDAEKIVFIRNSLTSSREVNIFQGTYNASNDYTVAAGEDVILKFDGAGAGAVVSSVLANPRFTTIATDTISEDTAAAGVTIDGVLLKDSIVVTDTINESTPAAGVTIDGVLLKDSIVVTDTINESTPAAGVTIDSVLLKDNIVTASEGTFTNINNTTAVGSAINGTVGVTTAAEGHFTALSNTTAAGSAINGSVGVTTAAEGHFTALSNNTAVGSAINGTIGVTTAAEGIFTTVSNNTAVGSAINGTIGVTTAAEGIFTFLSNNTAGGSAINGTIGATTAATGDFTALTASTINVSAMPTSSGGLSSGDLWSDSGTIKIVA